jgi:hypothetical protein
MTMTDQPAHPAVSSPEPTPPAPPLLEYQSPRTDKPLWNANAAACWCLLFSPAFGALLVAKNWDTLGFPDKAKPNRIFAYLLIAFLVVIVPLDIFVPAAEGLLDKIPNAVAIVLLLGWYFGLGKPQMQYIKATFGDNYKRRGWTKPILLAIAAVVGYFIYAFALGVIGALLAPASTA